MPGVRGKNREFCAHQPGGILPLSEEEIAAYIATGEPFDKAGAYGIQGAQPFSVKRPGDFFSSGPAGELLARAFADFAATCPKN